MIDEAWTIRLATAEDVAAIFALEQHSFSTDGFSKRQLRYLICRAQAKTWVVAAGEHLLAYLTVLLPKIPQPARLYSLAVSVQQRQRGFASHLLRVALSYAEQQGYDRMRLEVRASAAGAIHLYRKFGFENLCLKPGYYADGEDAWQMQHRFSHAPTQ